MDDAMRDTFARQGYVVVPDVLNQQQLDELNEVYDQHIEEREEMRSKGGTDKRSASPSGGATLTRQRIGMATPTWEEGSGAKPTGT